MVREPAKSRVGYTIVVLACVVALICTAPVLAQKKKAGPDAFVEYEVYDVPGLMAEIKRDPAALTRFAKFYGTSEKTILEYFESNLVVTQFPKTTTLQVWGYSPKVGFYPKTKKFSKGEPVFALRDGTPILRHGCANPFKKGLPPVVTPPEIEASEVPKEEVVEPPEPEIEEVVKAIEPVQEPFLTPPDHPETEVALAPLVPPLVEEEVAGLAQLAFLPAVAGGGGSVLPWLGLIPIGVAVGGGGGTVIPEPSLGPLAVLTTAAVIGFRIRRKK